MTTTTSISIQIPEGAEPGDTLTFEANGESLELVIPSGSQPGDVLEIQVGARGTDETNDEKSAGNDDVHKIDLGEGRYLELFSRLPTDHAEANDGIDNEEHAETSDGTHALPWQSGIEMAHSLQELERALQGLQIPRRRRILELGSGLGVVGISFAAALEKDAACGNNILSSIMADDAQITLTDLPAAMPLLNYNVEYNRSVLFPPHKTITTQALQWSVEQLEHDPFAKQPPFDCVLGSDLLYNIEYIPQLVATLKRLLHPIRGIVLLAVRWRKPDLERTFFRDSGLDWQLLPLKRTPCQLAWQEFGDASTDASNKYFHQTQIYVDGKPQALANITEEQAKDLPLEEFMAWERSFIQVYLGRPKERTL